MLTLSMVYPLKWPELIDRWESNVINAMDNISITNFIENLLGMQ